jgi:protein TonB
MGKLARTASTAGILLTILAVSPLIASPTWGQQSAAWPKVREFGGATPKNEAKWFTFADYPGAALRNGLQGNVIIAFDISAAGRAENCVVETASGHSELDNFLCPMIERRARFEPPRSADGKPANTRGRYSVAFRIPG